MTDMQAWLDQGRTLADRAADHVGRLSSGDDKWTMSIPPKDTDSDVALMSLLDGRLPQALDALQAVLDLHKPVDVEPSETICAACSNRLPNGRFMPIIEYPCPTVRAITDAIGGGDE